MSILSEQTTHAHSVTDVYDCIDNLEVLLHCVFEKNVNSSAAMQYINEVFDTCNKLRQEVTCCEVSLKTTQ